jgi:hypothetical protein
MDYKLFTDKLLTKTKCQINPDIPIINSDNAILYKIEKDDYQKTFGIPDIRYGLTKYNGRFYLFNHNIIETPRLFTRGESRCHSYSIHQITSDLAEKIINDGCFKHWEVYFNCLVNFGKIFISVRRGRFIETFSYESVKTNDILFVPRSISPSDLENFPRGITIQDYLKKNNNEYPNNNIWLELNSSLYREIKLNDILY